MKKNIIITVIVAVVVLGGLITWGAFASKQTGGTHDAFASCISESGATFYGAFWCPHCQAQKKLFGASAKLLPYHECSTPDGKGQLADCNDVGVQSYPTWVFADGSRTTGEQSFAELSAKTMCPLTEAEM